uniref:Uncharacterized protein n=1 Tax=Pyxicephalus adspersus TaxID=30357 RepID=A0AAV3AUI1_PYXAD|nr:TPA: hypothetical protein GDO54_008256 [Pyxicephalus adspersus]
MANEQPHWYLYKLALHRYYLDVRVKYHSHILAEMLWSHVCHNKVTLNNQVIWTVSLPGLFNSFNFIHNIRRLEKSPRFFH